MARLSVPPGGSQAAVLGGSDVETKRLAEVPMVYPDPEARAKASAAAEPAPVMASTKTATVSDDRFILAIVRERNRELVVLELPGEELSSFRLGDVLDDDDQIVARVVVNKVYPNFVLATAVEGQDQIRAGSRVRFARSKE